MHLGGVFGVDQMVATHDCGIDGRSALVDCQGMVDLELQKEYFLLFSNTLFVTYSCYTW